ncbi:uncharacterized protein LOC119560695 [Drosophila subpulchrella]|uniref:uncharacterized protein LOC119560695 n=1 Tax=Drosophila subpulchrella TaxID=1486046 RepID=UPI0018A1889E|nr:uncharacterized protein LOC119560695 [Drosophila subpulchrella]
MKDYLRKSIDFNVERKQELGDFRTYGFMKTVRSDTPIPAAQKQVSATTLTERLHSIHGRVSMFVESEVGSEGLPSNMPSVISISRQSKGMTSFEMKRKLFDEAEFTITRGKKLSDLTHPEESGETIAFKDPGCSSMEEIEAYCDRMHIKFAK